MSIKYALHPNPLTEDDEDHRAVVQGQESRTTNDIVEEIAGGGHSITKEDILAVVEGYERTIAKYIADGDRVNTSIMQISTSIAGVFKGTDDYFDPGRHKVNVNCSPGSRLQEVADNISSQKVKRSQRRPNIAHVKDYESGTINSQLTPGGVVEIYGSLLKHDPEDEKQGVFLVSDGDEMKAGPLVRNKPSTLMVSLPDNLPAAEYEVEVRANLRRTSSIRRGNIGPLGVAT